MRALFLAFALTACAPYETYEASCLNGHVRAGYGSVEGTLGELVFSGGGPVYREIAVIQTAAPLRPGTAGIPADDYPKPSMRSLECE